MPVSSVEGKSWIKESLAKLAKDHPIERVLDIGVGCGTYSDLLRNTHGRHWTGVEVHEKYLTEYDLGNKYDVLMLADARELELKGTYDVAFLGDVLEHMTREEALALYEKVSAVSRFVFISIPIIHMPQGAEGGNPYETHVVDDWTHEEVLASFSHVHKWYKGKYLGVYISCREGSFPVWKIKSQIFPRIGIYSITLNEERFINPCLNSIYQQADEIVVCDTGSTDQTLHLLNRWARDHEHIHCHSMTVKPWRFDVARNTSLSLLSPDVDIAICLDLDEILQPGWKEKLIEAWEPWSTRLRYQYIWSWTADGQPDVSYWADKIHSRNNYLWHHPVHEVLRPYLIQEEQTWAAWDGLRIHHYADRSKARSHYLPLLELAVQEDPHDDRNAFYLGREYCSLGMHEKAVRELHRHLALPRATWKAERSASMRCLAKSYSALGHTEIAEQWYLEAAKTAPEMREPWVALAQLMHDKRIWDRCAEYARKGLEIGEKPESSYIIEQKAYRGPILYDLLSIALWNLGDKAQAIMAAKEALKRDPSDTRIRGNIELMEGLAKAA